MCLAPATLLYSRFDYRGIKYDVYGLPATEDEECLVDEICLPGTRVNVMYLLSQNDIELIRYWVGEYRRMDYLTELREARVDSVIYEREVRKSDHQWRSF
jgi:hypothetical protein